MGETERFQLGTIGALTLSVFSSVSIVICNKALISTLGFGFGMLKKHFSFLEIIVKVVSFLIGYGQFYSL